MKFFIIAALLVLGTVFCASGAEIPVNIKADLLKYSEEKNLVSASGSVEVTLDNIAIKADRLTMDTKTNIVTAEGNVQVFGFDYSAAGDSLSLRVSDEVKTFTGFKTVQRPEKVKGELYLWGGKIIDSGKKMTGWDAALSTCNQKDPHFFVYARKVEYYPNDKIIGYYAMFFEHWIGTIPVPPVPLPIFFYDLKKKGKKNWTFGHNEVEGDFIKTVWDSPLPQLGSLLFIDYMGKKGLGLGTQFNYGEDSQVYLYGVDEKDTGIPSRVLKLNHNKSVNKDTRLTFFHASKNIYNIPSGRLNNFQNRLGWSHAGEHKTSITLDQFDDSAGAREQYGFSLNHSYKDFSSSYTNNLEQSKGSARWIRNIQNLTHSGKLFIPGTSYKTTLNYQNNIAALGAIGDERLDSDYTIAYSGKYFGLKLYENSYLDLDGGKYSADSAVEYLEKQPEITLTPVMPESMPVKLSPSICYGWYHEVKYSSALGKNRDFSANRLSLSLYADKGFDLPLWSRLNLSAGIDQYQYSPGDQLYAYSESASLNTDLLARVRNQFNFSRGITEGNSPFFFDKLNRDYSSLKESLTFYYKNQFDWTTSCGYNFRTRKKDDLKTSVRLAPGDKLSLKADYGFDLSSKKYLDLAAGVVFAPFSFFKIDFSGAHDANSGILKTAKSAVDLEIGSEEKWQSHGKVNLVFVYDSNLRNFTLSDAVIIKDLHCMEVKYYYSNFRKEFYLTFTIKALPDEPLGYAPDRGVYYEGLNKAINDEFNQSSPRRD